MRHLLFATSIALNSLLGSCLAYSAEDAVNSSVVTYDKEYFVKFDAVTLLDMLNRIPGVQEILNKSRREREAASNFGAGAKERGFGSGGDQILINGKRLAGKDNNIDDTLARVSADQVIKVDLIRGAAAGLDVQSEGLVINITLDQSVSKSTTFWKVGGRAYLGQKYAHMLTLSHSGSLGNLDYTATVETERKYRYMLRDEDYLYGGSDGIARQIEGFTPNKKDNHKLSTNITYNFEDGAILRLNGLFNPETQYDTESRVTTFLDESSGPAISVVDDTIDTNGNRKLSEAWNNRITPTKWEIGGDYSRGLGSLGSLKTLFVFNKENRDTGKTFTKGEGSSEFLYKSQNTKLIKSEAILRSSISKGIGGGQSIEIGGEAALNNFKQNFQNNTRASKTADLLLINDDDVKIKEIRYEIFANHSYTISSKISLQSSITAEFSKIVADNFLVNNVVDRREASFSFLKPRMNFRYDITNQDQLRLTGERKVSQLDFTNFSTSYNAITEKIDFGNTAIKPESSWDLSVAYERRLPEDSGSISLEVFYERYTDYIDKVDFTDYVDNLGNSINADAYFMHILLLRQICKP